MTIDHDHDRLPDVVDSSEPPAEPIANPGLPAHVWRPTDVDPKAEKRAERQVAFMFFLSTVCAVLFVVAYFTLDIGGDPDVFLGLGASNVALGLTLGGALLFIGIGVIQWARKLMSDHEIIEYRHPARSSDEDRQETLAAVSAGIEESGIGRRPLVRNSLLGAVTVLLAPAVIMLRDLGPTPNQVNDSGIPGAGLEHTLWTKGERVVRDVVGTPIKASDLEIGDLINAEPAAIFATNDEGEPLIEGVDLQVAKSKAAVILVRIEPQDITPGPGRDDWSVQGVHVLLQDLHPRGLPDLAVRAHHPPPAVPLPPVHLRPGRRRPGRASARPPGRSPSCRSRWTRRGILWLRATSPNPWDRASGSVTPIEH